MTAGHDAWHEEKLKPFDEKALPQASSDACILVNQPLYKKKINVQHHN